MHACSSLCDLLSLAGLIILQGKHVSDESMNDYMSAMFGLKPEVLVPDCDVCSLLYSRPQRQVCLQLHAGIV